MKRIAISQRSVHLTEIDELRDALDVRWGRLLQAANLLPVPVPSSVDAAIFVAQLGPFDGLILSGGNDVAAVSGAALDLRRDTHEATLLRALSGRPVLGICRGAQFLCTQAGGTLGRVEGHVRARHALHIAPGARWLKDYPATEVNSYHAYAPQDPGGLRVVARSSDGSIEALEHPDQPMLGILWHPEREPEPSPVEVDLLRRFFA